MNNLPLVDGPLAKARGDLQDATQAMTDLWGHSDADQSGMLTDIRGAVEALTRAVASVSLAVERIAVADNTLDYAHTPGDRDENGETDIERARRLDNEQDQEPDIDDEPPPDYGPPGSGAVITEYD